MTRTQNCIPTSSYPLFHKLRNQLFALFQHDHCRRICFLESISYKDLKKATSDFRRIVTCDSRGATYEAKFEDGSVSVVKELRVVDTENEVIYKEVQLLGRLKHRNVVALKGYSLGQKSFLIFESTAQGSLKDHLNDPLRTPLSWKTRVRIATGVAAALKYLQFFCEPPACHISISSSNIILDEKLTPKLSSIGYLSSEYHDKTPAASEGIEDLIPQFGALMLELITGQSSERVSADIFQWIQESHFNSSLHNMIDPDLGNSYSSKELRDALALARLCLKVENKLSFTVAHIYWYLESRFSGACS